ncbi:MAG: DUF1573 domain-containing protein [Verrucomicrobiota bacterium]
MLTSFASSFRFLIVALLGVVAARADLTFAEKSVVATAKPGQEVIVAEYPFTNDGTEPVTVLDMSSSCGCTVPELTKKTYAPGEKGVITARFTIGDRQGRQTKTITLKTNEASHTLRLSATLPVRVTAVPRLVVFRPADPEPKTITLVFEADAPVTILGIESLHPDFGVEVTTVTAGQEYELKISALKSPDAATRGNIRIRTKGASGREYTDMVYARHAP